MLNVFPFISEYWNLVSPLERICSYPSYRSQFGEEKEWLCTAASLQGPPDSRQPPDVG